MKTKFFEICFLLLGLALPASLWAAPVYKPEVLAARPHNIEHFTQGLFFFDAALYESAGRYGRSLLAVKDQNSGVSLREKSLPDRYFAEGSCAAWGKVYLLTWREQKAFLLDPYSLEERGGFPYEGEGWGLTFDGSRLIRSDGSARLFLHNQEGRLLGNLEVRDGTEPVGKLNELEWIPAMNLVLANIWYSPLVAAVSLDPEHPEQQGHIVFWLDLTDLIPSGLSPEAVANGIALAPDGQSLWLTGKLWPVMYQVAWPPEGF